MTTRNRLYWLIVLASLCFLAPTGARAECGGSQECIGVSVDATAPAHGTPLESPPIAFGNQAAASASAARDIRVGAVLGPPGTRATLTSITLTGPNASEFRISSTDCVTGTPSLLHDGNNDTAPQNTCRISVTFNPNTVGNKTATVSVSSSAITRTTPLTGTGIPGLVGPGAGPATLATLVNTPATINLAPFTSGVVTGIAIVTQPTRGTTTVNGTSVTFTPTTNYFGPDSFTYAAFNAAGSSQPATVIVNVGGRPDPARDPNVVGLVTAQAQAARRFAGAQLSNFQQRLESLRGGAGGGTGTAAGPGATSTASAPGIAARTAYAGAGTGLNAPASLPGVGGIWEARRTGLSGLDVEPLGLRPVAVTGASGDIVPTQLVSAVLNAAMSDGADRGAGFRTDGGIWVGGNLNFGTSSADNRPTRFRTDGITVGFDRRVSDRLLLGAGVGFAHDRTDIGIDGTKSRSSGVSVALYGSYKPTPDTFVDGLLGYGRLQHDSDRYVPAVNDYARLSDRTSHQFFGSLAGGWEFRRDGVLLSPYGRVDLSVDRFDQATETGAGANALTYYDHTTTTVQVAAGLRAESRHQTSFGLAVPRVRIELRHAFDIDRDVTVSFADLIGGMSTITPPGTDRTSLLLGVGSDFLFRNGVTFGVDYQLQRSLHNDRSHAVRLYLRKEFDGKGPSGVLGSTKLFENPVRVEAGYMWDDNLTRASDSADKRSDHVYSLSATKSTIIPLTGNIRAVLAGFVNGEKLYTYDGLDRFGLGARAEVQYRTSASFSAPTFSAFVRGSYDEYNSELRGGYRYQYGLSARQSWTDRIDAFVAATWNERHAKSDVFDASDYGARFNLDYSLGQQGVIYVSGDWRRGDIVSTGGPGYLATGRIAKASTPDDAFGAGSGLIAYRLEGRTVLWTAGYNYPLGPRDSIDFSWRQVEARAFIPEAAVAGYAGGLTPRYKANQFSIVYLVRF